MKSLYLDTKQKVYRATSIMFLVQLFGALGCGFFFVVQNILGYYHILGATGAQNESILWFILFWATDFFFVPMVLVLSYLIAGLPAIAPSLALSLYFCHFQTASLAGGDTYFAFFSTPANYADATAIGYMGYFIMAIVLSLLIKYLYSGWTHLKNNIGRGFDNLFAKLRKKLPIPEETKGIEIVEGVDLIVMILIIPVASAALTWLFVQYGIAAPFAALAEKLTGTLTGITQGGNIVLAAIVIGLMVGFDLIGPISLAAFSVCGANFLATGDSQLLVIYGVCFITVGWTAFFGMLCGKIFKKGTKQDTDDMNITMSGPINAFFENIKLTTAFAMPYAYRSPLTVIPGLMVGSVASGLLTAVFKITNSEYTLNGIAKFTGSDYTSIGDVTYAELIERGELYLSFTLPLRSGDWLRTRIPLFVIILLGGFIGGLFIMLLKMAERKIEEKNDCVFESNSDMVIEIRELGKKYAREIGKKYQHPIDDAELINKEKMKK